MKLMWFPLMPYTELLENFRETNDSVWIDINPGLFDPARGHLMYDDFIDEFEYAAEVGFDWWVKPLSAQQRVPKEVAA